MIQPQCWAGAGGHTTPLQIVRLMLGRCWCACCSRRCLTLHVPDGGCSVCAPTRPLQHGASMCTACMATRQFSAGQWLAESYLTRKSFCRVIERFVDSTQWKSRCTWYEEGTDHDGLGPRVSAIQHDLMLHVRAALHLRIAPAGVISWCQQQPASTYCAPYIAIYHISISGHSQPQQYYCGVLHLRLLLMSAALLAGHPTLLLPSPAARKPFTSDTSFGSSFRGRLRSHASVRAEQQNSQNSAGSTGGGGASSSVLSIFCPLLKLVSGALFPMPQNVPLP